MTTMFDAPMHDFTGDAMDADMLPSTVSNVDWPQVESMMEDGDTPRPTEEVDMMHGDVEEFEMRDVGEAEYYEELDHFLPEAAEDNFRTELQDQEIQDASRVPSPSPTTFSQSKVPTSPLRPDVLLLEPAAEQQAAETASPDPSTFQGHEGPDESSIPLSESFEEHKPCAEAGVTTSASHDTLTSGESNRSPYFQPQAELKGSHEDDAPSGLKPGGNVVSVESSLFQGEHPPTEGENHNVPDTQPQPVVTQVTQEEEETPLLDPPPSVSLSYPFDGTHFSLFNIPEDIASNVETPVPPLEDHKHESDAKRTDPDQSEKAAQRPILLFSERFALYYEPLSLVFEALRADPNINLDGRFDHNIELVLSAPELDLTLPEDNINAREVSLHDLGLLHTGCDLGGPLSLRLDTISPRFGSRYKAIRDEIVRVASQQEDEQSSQTDPAESAYTDGAPLHEPPRDEPEHESLNDRKLHHNDESVQQPSGCRTGDDENITHQPDLPDTHDVEASEDAEADGYENTISGELAEYEQYDEGQTGDDAEEGYEDGEGGYDDEQEDGLERPYENEHEHQPAVEEYNQDLAPENEGEQETTDEPFDHLDDHKIRSGEDIISVTDGSKEYESTPSPRYATSKDVENVTDIHESVSGASVDGQGDTIEANHNLHEVTSSETLLPVEMLSNAKPLLLDAKPLTRSNTPCPPLSSKGELGEVIAREKTVADDGGGDDEQPRANMLPSLPTQRVFKGSPAVSTISKRSYEEHQSDQHDGSDSQQGVSGETKRLRID